MTLRLAVAAVLGALTVLPAAARAADLPDLTITLPAAPYEGQVAPVYVDRFEVPGRVLYRFDAVIRNEGGTLDLYRDADTGEPMQALWPGGQPSTPPDPDAPPPSGTPASARGASGARFEYVFEQTHDHWHFFSAAAYALEVPGGAPRVSDKIGFCLYDSFDTDGVSEWFPADPPGAGTWCHFSDPGSEFVRMGLSPGAADRYASQREFQYVDVTGLAPGAYVLRGTANPEGHVLEADGVPDARAQTRVVPGVRADALGAATGPGAPVALTLAARAIAPEIPARLRPSCRPSAIRRGATCGCGPRTGSTSRSPRRRATAPSRSTARAPSTRRAPASPAATASPTPPPTRVG